MLEYCDGIKADDMDWTLCWFYYWQFLPLIWGGSELSMSGVLLGAVGGILGIWAGLKISQQ